MPFLYSIFFTLAFIALLPYFAYQAFVNRKYLSNFSERLGYLPESVSRDSRPAIWLHAVSVGETLAALPLLKGLHRRFPGHRLIVSTTTSTGQALARSRIVEAAGFCYFPFDWRFSVRRALDAIRPEIVILMESELWLNFLDECKDRGIPVIVANGRISDRSFRRSQKFKFFIGRLYAMVVRFAMQSKVDAERAIRLGAPADRVSVSGNIKYDIGDDLRSEGRDQITRDLVDRYAFAGNSLIVAGSTSEGEEELILAAFEPLRKKARLLIAPRHPERFDQVARLIDSKGFSFARRSENIRNHQAEVILLDTIGELAAIYSLASVVFVGGSLVARGGHNILEPALYGKPVIVGPHMQNFREITNEFLRNEALIQLRGANDLTLIDELQDSLSRLITDRELANRLGENGRRTVEENRGATSRTIEMAAELIEGR